MTENEIVLNRADSAVIARDYYLAARLYKSLLTKQPGDEVLLARLGNLYVKSGKDDDAMPYFQKIIDSNPENIDALVAMGGIFRRTKEYEKSIEVLEKAIAAGAHDPQINYNIGFTYKFMGQYDKAIEYFRSVVDENPNDVLAYNHIGTILAMSKNHEEAINAYKKGLNIDPNHPVLHLNMAKSFEALNQNENAAASYKAALRSKPGWTEAIECYIKLLLRTRHRKTAERLVSQTLGLNPRNAELYILLGNCLAAQSDFKGALDSYQKALSVSPDSKNAISGMAVMSEKLGRNADSMEFAQKLEQLEPENLDYLKQYADILLSSNHFDAALKRINNVLHREPKSLPALNLLGQYYLCTENDSKADSVYRDIESINPAYVEHYRDAAMRCRQIGNVAKAQRYVSKYLEAKPEDPAGLLVYAMLTELSGAKNSTLAAYNKVLKYDRYNAVALEAVKRLKKEIAEKAALMEELEKSRQNDFSEDLSEVALDIDDEQFEESEKDENSEKAGDDFDLDVWESEQNMEIEEENDDSMLDFADENLDMPEKQPVSLDDLVNADKPLEPDLRSAGKTGGVNKEPSGYGLPQMEEFDDDDLFNPPQNQMPQGRKLPQVDNSTGRNVPDFSEEANDSRKISDVPQDLKNLLDKVQQESEDVLKQAERAAKKAEKSAKDAARTADELSRILDEHENKAQSAEDKAEPTDAVDELAEDMEDPADAMGELAENMAEPSDAVDELAEDKADPADAVEELAEDMEDPADAVEELAEDKADPANAVGELAEGMADPADAVGELAEDMEDPADAVDELAEDMEEPTDAVGELAEDMGESTDAVDELAEDKAEPTDAVDELAGDMEDPADAVDELAEDMGESTDAVEELAEDMADPADAMGELAEDMEESTDAVEELAGDIGDPSDVVGELVEDMEEPTDAVGELAEDMADPANAVDELAEYMGEPSDAVEEQAEYKAEPADAVEEPLEELEELAEADEYDELDSEFEEFEDFEQTESLETLEPAENKPGLLKKTAELVPAIENAFKDSNAAEENHDLLKLFETLLSLSEFLPQEKKALFKASKNRIQLEFVISRLAGRPGLLAAAQKLRKTSPISPESHEETAAVELSGQDLTNAVLDMIAGLSANVKDASLSSALDRFCSEARNAVNEEPAFNDADDNSLNLMDSMF